MENVTVQMPLEQFEAMKRQLDEYADWDQARSMVIGYLEEHGHINKQTDWAYKTIALLKELDNMKAEV